MRGTGYGANLQLGDLQRADVAVGAGVRDARRPGLPAERGVMRDPKTLTRKSTRSLSCALAADRIGKKTCVPGPRAHAAAGRLLSHDPRC